MSDDQFSKRELEILKNYFLNKMSSHLKPIPLSYGRFFSGKLEIDIVMPFRRLFDFDLEYSEATQNIYIENSSTKSEIYKQILAKAKELNILATASVMQSMHTKLATSIQIESLQRELVALGEEL